VLRKLFDRWRPKTREYGEYPLLRGAFQQLDRFLYASPQKTTVAPHIRDANNVQRLMNNFVIATIPCWLIGTWNLGEQTSFAMNAMGMERLDGWRGSLIDTLGVAYDPASLGACLFIGLLYFLPILLVALVTGALWEALFAQKRGRPVDEGLLSIAWLFALILPATVPLYQVAIGMTFAMVVGKAIFGGTGRYLVSPPLLGMAFLIFSYSSIIYAPGAWIPVPGYDEPTTIELAIEEGGVAALQSVGYSWKLLFIGNQPGPVGITSPLGCLLGAIFLIVTGTASWRIMVGSFIGLLATVLFMNSVGSLDEPMFAVPWHWHMVIGGWAFGTVFLATDPVAAATTHPGRWGFGILVGALTVVVRVTNPSYYEGVIFAILLASIFSPLFDYVVVERNIKRRKARLATPPANGLNPSLKPTSDDLPEQAADIT
jgi:Na+-transporting NADH:ubiquinone oxidoreductase subunit B